MTKSMRHSMAHLFVCLIYKHTEKGIGNGIRLDGDWRNGLWDWVWVGLRMANKAMVMIGKGKDEIVFWFDSNQKRNAN